jgi:hypothetical protein
MARARRPAEYALLAVGRDAPDEIGYSSGATATSYAGRSAARDRRHLCDAEAGVRVVTRGGRNSIAGTRPTPGIS